MIQRPLSRCFLRQARGTKRLLLFPPSATADLYAYPPNHPLHRRSRVDLYAPRAVTAARFPRFASRALPTALDATLEVWRDFAENGPTAEEVEEAIAYLTGSYANYFLNSNDVVDYVLSIQIQDLPPDFPEFRNDLFRAVTLEDAQRTAQRLYSEELRYGLVGRPTAFSPDE